MARVPLEVTLMSAHGLEHQESFGRSSSTSTTSAVYALIYLVSGYDHFVHAMYRTPPGDSGGNNPEWGFTAGFSVPFEDINVHDLLFSLICSRAAGAVAEDYSVGDVRVSVRELLIHLASQSTGDPPWSSEFSYPVMTPRGLGRSTLCFRVRCGEIQVSSTAGEHSLDWVATGVPAAATTPLALTPAYEEAYLSDDSKFWRRRRNHDRRLFAFMLVMLVAWLLLLLLLLLHVLLSQVYLAGSHLQPPLQVILVYGYPALPRPAGPPPAPATKARPRWPAILLLGGLLAIIRCCT